MSSPLTYATLCLLGLAAACGEEGSELVAPRPTQAPPAAPVPKALVAPAILLSAYSLYYCYTPGGNRMCVILKRPLRVTSTTTTPLKWSASSIYPWIVVSPRVARHRPP
jgi:hypothetical protein